MWVDSISCSVQIYARKAELNHLPRAWITDSWVPALAAVVAAPIRKLRPENPNDGMLVFSRALLMLSTKWAFVGGERFLQQFFGVQTPSMNMQRIHVWYLNCQFYTHIHPY